MSDPNLPEHSQETLKAIDEIAKRSGPKRARSVKFLMYFGATIAIVSIGLTVWGLAREVMDGQGFSFWPVILGIGFIALVPGLLLYFSAQRIYRGGAGRGPAVIMILMGFPALGLGGFIAFGPSPKLILGAVLIVGALALSIFGARVFVQAQRKTPSV